MAKRNALFSLIKSLSPAEKRHFRLFTQSDKDTNHIKLFDAIERMSSYNEQKLKDQFKNEKFINQLHVTKNYLSNHILRSLRNFHKNFSKHAEVLDILHNVEILHSKGLYDYCKSEISRGIKIAQEYEILELEGLLYNWSIHEAQSRRSHDIPTFRKLIDGEKQAYERLLNSTAYKHVMLDCMENWMKPDSNQNDNSAVLADPSQAATLKAKVILHNSKFIQLITLGKDAEAIQYLADFLEELAKSPKIVKETPGMYLVPANNLIFNYIRLGKIEEGLALVDKIENLNFKLVQKAVLGHLLRTLNLKMILFKDGEMFFEKQEEIADLQRITRKYEKQMPTEHYLTFSLLFGIYHCCLKQPEQALEWLKPAVNFPDPSVSFKTQVGARIIELIVQFELKNYFLLPYHADKTKRFITKNGELLPHQNILLKFMRKIANTPEGEFREAFLKLFAKLNPEGQPSLVKPCAIECLDYNYWIRSKFEQTSPLFAETKVS